MNSIHIENPVMSTTTYATIVICLLSTVLAELVVQTNSGPIKGVTALSEEVEAFLGIPYAEPPVGDLRFAKPVPKRTWTETLNASKLPPPCVQFSFGTTFYFTPDVTNMSEDCLYLNLWSPKSISDITLKPVIIFLHPGGFLFGSSSLKAYDGSNFAKRSDAIVATINYRLGPFGYFSASIEEAPGNMGMYDQVMAIKWIKDNSILFGGDSENIVLMGESAGGLSIAAHMVSPISKNLFQKAIIQSGGVVFPYFFDNNTRLTTNSESIALITGCSNKNTTLRSDPHYIVDCLKRQSVDSILRAQNSLVEDNALAFVPRTGDEFLPQPAVDLLREGKFKRDVPVLTGFNKDEGAIILTTGISDYFGTYGQNKSENIRKQHVSFIARTFFRIGNVSNVSEVLDYYISQVKNRNSQGYTKMLADALGDASISCPTLFQADFLSLKGNPVYLYKFSFRAHSTPMAEWVGTTHFDEMQYVFGNPYHKNFTEEEVKLSHLLIDRWSAFARTGSPNIPGQVPWLRYSFHNPLYLSIEQEEESIRIKPLERCKIWRKRFKAEMHSDLVRLSQNSEQPLSQMRTA